MPKSLVERNVTKPSPVACAPWQGQSVSLSTVLENRQCLATTGDIGPPSLFSGDNERFTVLCHMEQHRGPERSRRSMVQVIENKEDAGAEECIEFRVYRSKVNPDLVLGGWQHAESVPNGQRGMIAV